MKYSPAEDGSFDGQRGYGYLSFEKWIDALTKVNKGEVKPEQYDQYGLPTIKNTYVKAPSTLIQSVTTDLLYGP